MMERHERAVVLAALERNRWRMTKTAEELGLERSHLYKKAEQIGIDIQKQRREEESENS